MKLEFIKSTSRIETGEQMICHELLRRRPSAVVDLNRYGLLHIDGKHLISSWLKRAWGLRGCPPEECFEPFIFTWISFNGWAACVTGSDDDWEWLNALKVCPDIRLKFDTLLYDKKSALYTYAHDFYNDWPIFKAQDIRRRGVYRHHGGERRQIVNSYLDSGVNRYEPQCWRRHRDLGESIPFDWPHTLSALYRVRCNLFHGEKSAHSEMDARIVSNAFRVLMHFLKETKYIVDLENTNEPER